MIYFIYGENEVKNIDTINNLLNSLIKENNNYEEVTYKDIEDIPHAELISNTTSSSLFGQKNLYALKLNTAKLNKDYLKVIEEYPKNENLILYCNKDIKKSSALYKNLAAFKNTKVIYNKKVEYENIFTFTDALFYKNRKKTYQEYTKIEEVALDDYYVFSMVLWALRQVTFAFYNTQTFKSNKGFRKGILESQKKLYSKESINNIYIKFYDYELAMKSQTLNKKVILFNAIETVLNS